MIERVHQRVFRAVEHLESAFWAIPIGVRARIDADYREGFVSELIDVAERRGRISFWDQTSLYLLRMPDFQDAFRYIDAAQSAFKIANKSAGSVIDSR